MDAVNVRNLEQIREQDSRRIKSRLGTLVLASLGGAGIVVAVMFSSSHSSAPQVSKSDALAQLAAQQRTSSGPATRVDSQNVSFPNVLSDSDKPTTALAAVKDEQGRLVPAEPTTIVQPELPPGSDKIPGSQVPAADLLNATSALSQPQDQLSRMAAAASQVADDAELVAEGHEGGVQIQVASFRTIEDADTLVRDLRHKGHHAFRQPAYVPERGLWQRVRIGPFRAKIEAIAYRNKLEQTERILAFVVDPDRKRRQAADRESVLSSREKKSVPSGT
jgi:cell division septation protein DedD